MLLRFSDLYYILGLYSRSEYADKTSQFRYIFDDLQRSSQCCGVESPLDYNGSFWQLTETEYFSDYERRALNTSLDEDHIDVDFNETLIEEQGKLFLVMNSKTIFRSYILGAR